jgi:hypothetical protein
MAAGLAARVWTHSIALKDLAASIQWSAKTGVYYEAEAPPLALPLPGVSSGSKVYI